MSCEYCKGEKPIIENSRGIRVNIDDYYESLFVAWYGDNGWDGESISITYCPMCGSKLGDSYD